MRYIISLLLIFTTLLAKEAPMQNFQKSCTAKSYLPIKVILEGKPQAGSAKVTLQFQKAFSDVTVSFKGIDGLQDIRVVQATKNLTVTAGSQKSFDLFYNAPEGRSYFSVEITTVNGANRTSMVKAFQVGEQSSVQKKAALQNVQTDSQGNRIVIMPATKR